MRSFNFVIPTIQSIHNDPSQEYASPIIDLLALNISPERPIAGTRIFKNTIWIDNAAELDDLDYLDYNIIIIEESIDIDNLDVTRRATLSNIANATGIQSFINVTLPDTANAILLCEEFGFNGCLVHTLVDLTAIQAANLQSTILLSEFLADEITVNIILVDDTEIEFFIEGSVNAFKNTLSNKTYDEVGCIVTTQADADRAALHIYAYDLSFIICLDSTVTVPTNLDIYVGENKLSGYDLSYPLFDEFNNQTMVSGLVIQTDVGKLYLSNIDRGHYIFINELARISSHFLSVVTEDTELKEQVLLGSYIKTHEDRDRLQYLEYELYEGQQLERYTQIAFADQVTYSLYINLTPDMNLHDWAATQENVDALPIWMDWRNKYTIETKAVPGTDTLNLPIPSHRFIQPIMLTDSTGAEINIVSWDKDYIVADVPLTDDEYVIKFQAKANAWIITNAIMSVSAILKDSSIDIRTNNVIDFDIDYWNGLCQVFYNEDIASGTFEINSIGYPMVPTELVYNSYPYPICQDENQFIHSKVPAILMLNEEDQYIVCKNLGTYPNNVWTPLDEWGLLLSTPRHDGENLTRYRLRLMDVFEHYIGSDQEGMERGLFRELCPTGMDTDTFISDNDDDPLIS